MFELNGEIARLEIRSEQLIIHLRTTRNAPDADVRRADLYALLKEMERLKRKRERLESELGLSQAA